MRFERTALAGVLILAMARTLPAQQPTELVLDSAALASPRTLALTEPLELFRRDTTPSGQRPVVDLTVAADGSVYLLSAFDRKLSIFDEEGRSTGTLTLPLPASRVAVGSGTILLLESRRGVRGSVLELRRIDRRGARIAEPARTEFPRTRLPRELYGYDRGWTLVYQENDPSREIGPRHDSLLVARLNAATFDLEPVIRVAYPPTYWVTRDRLIQRDMAPYPTVAVSSSGRVYLNRGRGYSVEVLDRGERVGTIRGPVERIPYTTEQFEEHLEERIAWGRRRGGGAADYADVLEEHAPEVGHAEVLPVLGGMHASPGEVLLVMRRDLTELARREGRDALIWDVLDAEEGFIGRLRTPSDGTIMGFRWPHVFMRFDLPGERAITRYRIVGAR